MSSAERALSSALSGLIISAGGDPSVATDAAAPVGKAGAGARTGGQSFFQAIAGYYGAGSKNAELEQEVKIARVKLAEAGALKQENARLKATLGLKDADQKPVALGRLIGSTSSSTRRFAYLSVGTSDGVAPDMPVVSSIHSASMPGGMSNGVGGCPLSAACMKSVKTGAAISPPVSPLPMERGWSNPI